MSGNFCATQGYTPEKQKPHQHCFQNLKRSENKERIPSRKCQQYYRL